MDWPPKVPKSSPLTLHPRGWQASIAGRTRWIAGKVPHAQAVAAFHRKAASYHAEQKPPPTPKMPADLSGGPQRMTIGAMLNAWLIDRRGDVVAGRLKAHTWGQYRRSAKRVNALAGHMTTEEWTPTLTRWLNDQIAKGETADIARRTIGHFRDACVHAEDFDYCLPVRIGTKVVRELVSRAAPAMTANLLMPAEVSRLVALAKHLVDKGGRGVDAKRQVYAMILLALNGGFGAAECAELRRDSVDLAAGLLKHARGKTGADHSLPLWSETVSALRVVMAERPHDALIFRTRSGQPWATSDPLIDGGKVKVKSTDNIRPHYNALCAALGIRRFGQSFYRLKHLACTTADNMQPADPHATFAVYGHRLPGAKGHYVAVDLDRQRRVVEHVRHVLLVSPPKDSRPLPDVRPRDLRSGRGMPARLAASLGVDPSGSSGTTESSDDRKADAPRPVKGPGASPREGR